MKEEFITLCMAIAENRQKAQGAYANFIISEQIYNNTVATKKSSKVNVKITEDKEIALEEIQIPLTMVSQVTGLKYGYVRHKQGSVPLAESILRKHLHTALIEAKREYKNKVQHANNQ